MNFTDKTFKYDVVDNVKPVIVDFWAPWCGPCKMVSPIIDELAKEYKGKVKVGKINVDENPKTASQFGIMSIPAVMLFKGGKPVQTVVGARSKISFQKVFDPLIAS